MNISYAVTGGLRLNVMHGAFIFIYLVSASQTASAAPAVATLSPDVNEEQGHRLQRPQVPTEIKPIKGTKTKVIPLPVYATQPNEGSTFGFMPVFLTVEKSNQRTETIL